MKGGFSVIIPTLNNADKTPRLISSILSQTSDQDEIVVVDGGSTDGTIESAAQQGVRVIQYPGLIDRRGYARNLGTYYTTGKWLLFLDSDMELQPGVFNALRRAFEAGYEAVTIPEITCGTGVAGKLRVWERRLTGVKPELTFSRALTREVFERAGGFDERIIGFEDLDLQATLIECGTRIGRVESPIIHHEEGQTLRQYLIKRRKYEASASLYRRKHPTLSSQVFSPVARLQLYARGISCPTDTALFALAVAIRVLECL